MTTLYKINGRFRSWEDATERHGYTTTATETVEGFRRTDPWGEYTQGSGYLDKHSSDDVSDWELWNDEMENWNYLDTYAVAYELFPSYCIDTELTNGSSVSPAVYFENGTEVWYLIRDAVSDGWIEENDLAAHGWYHVDDTSYEFILFDTTEGKVTYGVETLNEMAFAETGYFTIEDGNEVVFVEQSPFPVVCTFTQNYLDQPTVADGDSVDTDLPYYASKLYLPVAVVTTDPYAEYYGWDVSEEQPAPALPTVTTVTIYTDNSDHYYQTNVTNQTTQVSSQYTYNLYTDSGCTNAFVYEQSSLYLVGYLSSGIWKKSAIQSVSDMPSSVTSDVSSAANGRVLQTSGKIWFMSNFTDTLHDGGYQWSNVIKVCSSNQATVVTVYNSSNVAYNAFKFTANGTDYYYVLDGTQTDWTDDLSSIGYRDANPTLPTVTLSDRNWISIHPNHQDFVSNTTREGWVWSFDSNTWVVSQYDSALSYASGFWSAENSNTGRYGIMLGDYGNGAISISNVLTATITRMIEANYSTCSSNQAIAILVVKVSDGVFYTAFKYSVSGTDYYWVLDDVQTAWVYDLESIGYRLPRSVEFVLGFSWNSDETELVAVEMQNGWSYWNRVSTDAEATTLQNVGLWYNSGYKYGSASYDIRFVLMEIYSDVGETPASVNLSDFSIINMNNVLGLRYNGASTTVPITSYKALILV